MFGNKTLSYSEYVRVDFKLGSRTYYFRVINIRDNIISLTLEDYLQSCYISTAPARPREAWAGYNLTLLITFRTRILQITIVKDHTIPYHVKAPLRSIQKSQKIIEDTLNALPG